MKRYNVNELKNTILESTVNRGNILCLLESSEVETYRGYWRGHYITLDNGVQLTTEAGMKMKGIGLPVKVYNKNGQYLAYAIVNGKEETGSPIKLTYVLNEVNSKVTDIVIFD